MASLDGLFARGGSKKMSHVGALLESELSKLSWLSVFGFAVCQAWITICLTAPARFDGALSLVEFRCITAFVACAMLGVFCAVGKNMPAVAGKKSVAVAVAVCVGISGLCGACDGFGQGFEKVFAVIAATGMGVGLSFLQVVWLASFWRREDVVGLIVGVVFSSMVAYPLMGALASEGASWLVALLCASLPTASVLLLPEDGRPADLSVDTKGLRAIEKVDRDALIRYSFCLFVVVAAIEACRSTLATLSLQVPISGSNDLVGILVRCVFGAVFVFVFAKRDMKALSVVYRGAFLLMLSVVLSVPFLVEGSKLAYALLETGAFCFGAVMYAVLIEIANARSVDAVFSFALMRAVWAIGVAFGAFVGEMAGSIAVAGIPILVAAGGVLCAFSFVFVFTDAHCIRVLTRSEKASHATPFKDKCDAAAHRAGLSTREGEIMAMVAKGRSAPRIAEDLGVSLSTVNSHIYHIYQKMGVHSRQQMIDYLEGVDAAREDR